MDFVIYYLATLPGCLPNLKTQIPWFFPDFSPKFPDDRKVPKHELAHSSYIVLGKIRAFYCVLTQYVCVCMRECVWMCVNGLDRRDGHTNIHTHTNTHKYIHTYTRILNTSPWLKKFLKFYHLDCLKIILKWTINASACIHIFFSPVCIHIFFSAVCTNGYIYYKLMNGWTHTNLLVGSNWNGKQKNC